MRCHHQTDVRRAATASIRTSQICTSLGTVNFLVSSLAIILDLTIGGQTTLTIKGVPSTSPPVLKQLSVSESAVTIGTARSDGKQDDGKYQFTFPVSAKTTKSIGNVYLKAHYPGDITHKEANAYLTIAVLRK